MADNFFAGDDMKDTAASPAVSSHIQAPENFFAETSGEPPANPGANETIIPKSTPAPTPGWQQGLIDGVSVGTAREAARSRTQSERLFPRQETPEEASFWGAVEHGLGPQNIEALAGTLDFLGDATGDKAFAGWSREMRDSLEKDKSSYKAVFESFRQIRGLTDAWGYVKERAGQMVGPMLPSIAMGTAGAVIGGLEGSTYGGKYGATIGGAVGATAGAASGTLHLHISDMRQALVREGVTGEDLTKFTAYGAAALVSLDMMFPAAQAMKLAGTARRELSNKVAQQMIKNLAAGGKMRTVAEFTKAFGKDLIRDIIKYEVTTELAQQAITDLGAKKLAGKEISAADVTKFATETAPEVAISTIIGAGFMGIPGSAVKGFKDVRDAKAGVAEERASASNEVTIARPAHWPDPVPAPIAGTPAVEEAATSQPQSEDPSQDLTPKPAEGAQGVSVLQFIRSQGGMMPSGELDALDAHRYPGLINQGGKSVDAMREALVDAGYLEESGPDQPSVTTPADVYDLVQRAISGERIVPLADAQADSDFTAAQNTKNAIKELEHAEKQFVLPEIERYDEELGDPIVSQTYKKLAADERMEVIDRTRRGEDAADVIEEIAMRNVDIEAIQALVLARGPDPELVTRIRGMVAEQQPDLLNAFDDLAGQFPVRRPPVRRDPAPKINEEPSPTALGLGARLKEVAGDQPAFDAAIVEMERDRKLSKEDARQIAADYLGKPPKPGSRASYFQAVRNAQGGKDVISGGAGRDQVAGGTLPGRPAVPVQQSITPGAIVSLLDGSKHADIRAHLKSQNIAIEDYQRNFQLGDDYLLVAPNLAAQRYESAREKMDYDSFEKQFTIGGVKQAALEAMTKAAPAAAQGAAKPAAAPARDLSAEFTALLAGKTPRAKWGQALGLADKQLAPLIERAVEGGLLVRDARGVARRAPNIRDSFTPDQVLADLQSALAEPGQTMATDAGLDLPTPKSVRSRAAQVSALADRLAAMPASDAIRIAEALLGRPLAPAERRSRAQVIGAVKSYVREVAETATKALKAPAGTEALILPGQIGGENVTLTPKAIDKIQELKAIAEEAVAKILPRDVRIEVVDNIAIDRLAHEDELLALRSSKSAKVSEGTEGESDESGLQEDSGEAGQAGDDASQSAGEGEIAAAVGGGGASGASTTEGRILRQESATLRADGSIRAGRVSGKAAASSGLDAETLQPVGTSEFFDAPGLRGVVTAMPVADHAGLARRGAPASEYRLANLTYRLYAPDAPLTEAQLTNFQPNFRGGGDFHAPSIWARVSQHMDGTWEVSMVQRIADRESAPKGMANKLYAAIEKDLGIRMSPSGILSKEGLKMWQKRSPESVKWHQWSKSEGYFISPRRIKDNIARIGMDLSDIAARPDTDPNKAEDHAIAMAERKELIKLWTKLPLEARGSTPNTMFSLRQSPNQPRTATEVKAFHGTPNGALESFRSEAASEAHDGAFFFTSNSDGTSPYTGEAYFDSPFGGEMQPTVYPIFVETRGFKEIDWKGQTHNDGAGPSGGNLNDEMALAKQEGFPGLVVKNMDEAGGAQDWFIAWTPSTVRSAVSDAQMFSLRGFYSPAIRAAESISMKRGTGEQFLKQITKVPGVRKDEIEWMGLEEFLSGKKSVTKDDVLDFMRAHQIELDEKVLADERYDEDTIQDAIRHIAKAEGIRADEVEDNWGYANRESYVDLAFNQYEYEGFPDREKAGVKFAGHKVPGGENYRELLIRLPSLENSETPEINARLDEIDAEIAALEQSGRSEEGIDPERRALYAEQSRLLDRATTPKYVSKHFEDQEIVHLRVDDRTGPNGEKVLFINEVQSDLHQAGRQKGYGEAGKTNVSTRRAEIDTEVEALLKAQEGPAYRDLSAQDRQQQRARIDALEAERGELSRTVVPPNAPLKGDLWLELALKRALLYASENGYDAISWARSDQIAKAVGAEPEKLALQYDSKIGKFLDRYTKKWGGKVEEAEGIAPTYGPPRGAFSVPEVGKNSILRVTPQMRASVMQGQPLSARQGEQSVQALGQTDPVGQIISIGARAVEEEARATGKSMAKITAQVARHEALEFFLDKGFIQPREWAALTEAAAREGWVAEMGVSDAYAELYRGMAPAELDALILKESIMEKFARYERGQYQPTGVIAQVFQRIAAFFASLREGLKGNGFQTWEDIFQKIDAGELRRRYEAIYGSQETAVTGEAAAPQPMIRAGQLPDARGIAQTPGQQSPAGSAPMRGISELIEDARRAMGLTHRTGRLDPALRRAARQGGGELLGQYNGVARTQIGNDIDVFSHEAGHHLERTLGGDLTNIITANAAELTPLGPGYGNPLSEGFAEFFRRYVTNPTSALQHAPNFYRDFEDLLDASNPALARTLENVQQEYDRFLLGDPIERGVAQQTVLRRPGGPVAATRRFLADAERDGYVSTMADRLYDLHHGFIQSVFDKQHGWWMATRALLNDIEARSGRRVSLQAATNPFKLMKLASHTQAWAQQDLKHGIALRSRPNGGGVSLHQVLATAFGGTASNQWHERRLAEFGDYLVARRSVHQYVRYRPQFRQVVQQFVAANPQLSFLLPRLPQNIVAEIENPPTAEPLYEHLNRLVEHERRNPQFRQAAELYYQFNRDMISLLHEKGLITDEERAEYHGDRDYAPFQRDMSDRDLAEGGKIESRRPGRKRDQANKHDVYRAFNGSMRDIINPIQSTIQTVFEVRLRAAINDALAAMDALARQAGPAGNEIFERIPPNEARAMEVSIRESLRAAARAAGMSPTDTAIMLTNVETQIGQNAVVSLFTQQQASEKGEKIVWFFEKGRPVPAVLADGALGNMMFEGLTAVGRRNMGMLIEAMTLTAATVRTGVTFSPAFILRNIWVDAISAPVNSPHARPFTTQVSGMREIFVSGQYLHMYNRYAGMLGGAAHASIADQTVDRDIEMLRQTGFNVRRPRSLRELLSMVFRLGEFSETATRVGIFRNAMRSAVADGMTPFDAAIEAGHYAHDVMDFSQHGSKTETLRRIIPFFNAALQGMYRYGKTLTAANDYGNLIQIYQRHQAGQPLSRNEQLALGQAYRAWMYSTVVFGGISLIFCMLGADDEDMKEVPDSIRATNWRISIDGILYLLPKNIASFIAGEDGKADWLGRLPKNFEMAWFANGVERAWDYFVNHDPAAARRMASDMFTVTMPPHSPPSLDLAYGFLSGKDMYSGNDIVPIWEKGKNEKERADQFGPYTSQVGKSLGSALNISPYYADFLVRNLFASVGQDVTTAVDMLSGKGPLPEIGEYPVARRFSYNTGKASTSLQTFYNMVTDNEGLTRWFWDTVSDDARSFSSAANTYKDLRDKGGENAIEANAYLGRVNPDQQVFAVLSVDFEKKRSKLRNLHPIINASEGISTVNALMKEVTDGTLMMGKEEEKQQMSRDEMRFARNELGHVRKGMAQNSLRTLSIEGWAAQPLMDIDARLATLKAGAPKVHEELVRRLQKKDYINFKHVNKVWPEVRKRVLASRKEAQLSDLADGKVEAY